MATTATKEGKPTTATTDNRQPTTNSRQPSRGWQETWNMLLVAHDEARTQGLPACQAAAAAAALADRDEA